MKAGEKLAAAGGGLPVWTIRRVAHHAGALQWQGCTRHDTAGDPRARVVLSVAAPLSSSSSSVALSSIEHKPVDATEADVDAGYSIYLSAKPFKADKGHPLALPKAAIDSVTSLLYILLSGEFKMTKKMGKVWRRTYCLMMKTVEAVKDNQSAVLLLLALAWYTFGASLIGRATFQLIVFSPETMTPPWISVMIATQHAALNCSEFAMDRLALVFASFTSSSVQMKILLVLLSVTPLVLIFGPMYRAATYCSWPQALMKIHSIVHRLPGANMVAEPSAQAHAVVNVAYFCGLFTFAVFLGIVSDELKRSFQRMRVSSYPLHLEGHTLLLNWSSDTISLLKQLDLGLKYSEAHSFKRPIVVMAAKDKTLMDQEISSRLPHTKLKIYTRFGNPSFPKHLAMVAAKQAHMIIVLHPEGVAPHLLEPSNAATAMALGITGCKNMVFQTAAADSTTLSCLHMSPEQGSLPAPPHAAALRPWSRPWGRRSQPAAALLLGAPASGSTAPSLGLRAGPKLLTMPDRSFQDRITCQTSVQPGVLGLWRKILQEGPNCFKLRLSPLPQGFAGLLYQELRRSYQDCIVVGFVRDDQAHLNPDDGCVIAYGDQVVVLSFVQQPRPRPWVQQMFREAGEAARQRTEHAPAYVPGPKHVIVAGWKESKLMDVVQCYADVAPDNSSVTFILRSPASATLRALPRRQGSCSFRYLQADNPTSTKALLDAGIKTADSLVLTGLVEGAGSSLESDSLVLASLLQVQNAVAASGRAGPPRIITSVQHSSTRQVIKEFFSEPFAAAVAPVLQQPLGRGCTPTHTAPQQLHGTSRQQPSANLSAGPTLQANAGFGSHAQSGPHRAAIPPSPVAPSSPLAGCSGSADALVAAFASSIVPLAEEDEQHHTSQPAAWHSAGSAAAADPPHRTQDGAPTAPGSTRKRNKPAAPHQPRASLGPLVSNPEVFMPDDVRTALLAQVASQPDIAAVVRRLLTSQEGTGFRLHDPAALNIATGETCSFAEVSETARRLRHTAAGYLLASGRLVLVLEPSSQHTFQEGDQVVLITTDPRR